MFDRQVSWVAQGDSRIPNKVLIISGAAHVASLFPLCSELESGGYECRAFQLAGFGDSDYHLESLALDDILSEIEAQVKKAAGEDPIILVGHSLGALVSVVLAAEKFREQVSKLVLLAPAFEISEKTISPLCRATLWLAASLPGPWSSASLRVLRFLSPLLLRLRFPKGRIPLRKMYGKLNRQFSTGEESIAADQLLAESVPLNFGPVYLDLLVRCSWAARSTAVSLLLQGEADTLVALPSFLRSGLHVEVEKVLSGGHFFPRYQARQVARELQEIISS